MSSFYRKPPIPTSTTTAQKTTSVVAPPALGVIPQQAQQAQAAPQTGIGKSPLGLAPPPLGVIAGAVRAQLAATSSPRGNAVAQQVSGMPTGGAPPGLAAARSGALSGTGASAAADPQSDLDKLYNDIYNEHQKSWSGTEQMINAQTQMDQRRAAEINAMMGRSIGGGFGGIMAQAQLNGQRQLLGARQQWEDRGRQLQLGELDRKLQEKHRLEDLEAQSQGATGSREDPMAWTSAAPGTTMANYVGLTNDGKVLVLGTDGKYYSLTKEDFQTRTGKNPDTGMPDYVNNRVVGYNYSLSPEEAAKAKAAYEKGDPNDPLYTVGEHIAHGS